MSSANYYDFYQVLLRGYKSVGEKQLVYTFGPGMTLFKGPNGVGKTTIFDGLYYNLFDDTLSNNRDTKVKIDDVVNSIYGGNALTITTFCRTHGGKQVQYMNVRGRKPAVFYLVKLDKRINLESLGEIPLNRNLKEYLEKFGTIVTLDEDKKKSQAKFVNEYLQIDKLMFTTTRLASAKKMNFVNLNDADRYGVICNVFDASWMSDVVAECKDDRKDEKEPMDAAEKELLVLNSKVEDVELHLAEQRVIYDNNVAEIKKIEKANESHIFDINEIKEKVDINEQSIEDTREYIARGVTINNLTSKLNLTTETAEASKKSTEKNFNTKQGMLEEQKKNIEDKLTPLKEKDFKFDIDTVNKKLASVNINIEEMTKAKNNKDSILSNLKSLTSRVDTIRKDSEELGEEISKLENSSTKVVDVYNEKKLEKEAKLSEIPEELDEELTKAKDELDELNKVYNEKLFKIKDQTLLKGYYSNDDLHECSECKQKITAELKAEVLENCQKVINEVTQSKLEIEDDINEFKISISKLEESSELKTYLTNSISDIEKSIENSKTSTENALKSLNARKDKTSIELEKVVKEKELGDEESEKLEECDEDTFAAKIKNRDTLTKYSNTYDATNETIKNLVIELEDVETKLKEPIKYEPIYLSLEDDLAVIQKEIDGIEFMQVAADHDEMVMKEDIAKNVEFDELLVEFDSKIISNNAVASSIRSKLIDIESIENTLKAHRKSIIETQLTYDNHYKEYTINNNIINIFTNKAMRGVLFSKHVNSLNHYIRSLINILNLPYKIKLENDFSITASGFGLGSSLGVYSNGQQHMINVIIFATFKMLVTTMSKFDCNLVLLDEYFDVGLDVENINNLMELVKDIYKNEGVIIITHKEFDAKLFDRQYEVSQNIYTTMTLIDDKSVAVD